MIFLDVIPSIWLGQTNEIIQINASDIEILEYIWMGNEKTKRLQTHHGHICEKYVYKLPFFESYVLSTKTFSVFPFLKF